MYGTCLRHERGSIAVGELTVKQQQVMHPALQGLRRMRDVTRQIHQHAVPMQGSLKGLGHLRLVFHQQYAHARPRPARTAGMKGGDANTR